MAGWLILVLSSGFLCGVSDLKPETRATLQYAAAPLDNPLKGLVPYSGVWQNRFPHSQEFDYLPLSSLVIGEDRYDWTPLEKLLEDCASRGHQVIFRIYLEFPGKTDGIPAFLTKDGLTIHKYRDTTSSPPVNNITPDYTDPRLRKILKNFIAALGKKYDGDRRIGFITAGLLGHWGEWHTYPREELFADKAVQVEVMNAYESAFKTTPVLMRYPLGPNHETNAANVGRRFGYHDDSFAWATLDTGRKEDSWYYMTALKTAGPEALVRWKTQPIGGEIRPEAWGMLFDETSGNRKIQDFRKYVQETHASWLMDSGIFKKNQPTERRKRAEDEVRRMGYEFHISAVTIGKFKNGQLPLVVELENRGVAPFYYGWPGEFSLIADGKIIKTFPCKSKLTGLLPGEPVRVWNESLDVRGVATGTYRLALRVANPLPKGNPSVLPTHHKMKMCLVGSPWVISISANKWAYLLGEK